jgi:aminocarboxymuconate-semialdehyde decarboxylase
MPWRERTRGAPPVGPGGRLLIVVDAHTHFVPRAFPPPPSGVSAAGWPTMTALPDGRAQMMVDGAPFRVFEQAYWDVPARLAAMDADGVAVQVLSPLPELLSYWLEPAATAALAAWVNRCVADAVATAPGRMAGMGMLPMQDASAALKTLAAADEMGLRGVIVASNVNGASIAEQRFHPVLAELERRGLVLFVHGYRPAGVERMLGSPMLAAVIGVPQDTMAAVASFILTDVLGRFPRLKICFVQGGGTFGAVLDRLDHTWGMFPQMQQAVAMRPQDYARRFYFDTVTFSVPYLRLLVEMFGADSLVAGSDGPSAVGQRGLEAFVGRACGADREAAEKILWRNAARLFDLPNPEPAPAARITITASGAVA